MQAKINILAIFEHSSYLLLQTGVDNALYDQVLFWNTAYMLTTLLMKFPVCNFQKTDARYIIPYKFNVSYSGLTKTMEMTTILDIMGRVINTEIRNCVLSVHYMQCHESIVPAYSMSEIIKSIHNKYSKQTEKNPNCSWYNLAHPNNIESI